MAFDEQLGDRIRRLLQKRGVDFEEKHMMGGLCFMVDDKMCVGIYKNMLMARINPEEQDTLLAQPGAMPMELTGRPMKGFLFVDPEAIEKDQPLDQWVGHCLAYNPLAKRSKKKR